MNMKEVEALLNVSRSNIRFYEKEGLLQPQRKDNNYRDYSQEDIATLRKILVLRKLGFTVEEIADMQQGDLSLADASTKNIQRLEQEIHALKGALKVTKALSAEAPTIDTMDDVRLWEEINRAEEEGQAFIDICNDYLIFELNLFDNMWKHVFGYDFKDSRKKHGIPIACGFLLLLCIIRGISRVLIWHEPFWDGFLYPIIIFAIGSAILLPVYVLSKTAPKAARVVSTILAVLGIGLIALCVGLLLYGIICSFCN